MTPLVRLDDGGETFRPHWPRTRRAAFVTSLSAGRRYDLAERTVRGFLKWVGAKWQQTLAYEHDDNARGSAAADRDVLARARALGAELTGAPPLAP